MSAENEPEHLESVLAVGSVMVIGPRFAPGKFIDSSGSIKADPPPSDNAKDFIGNPPEPEIPPTS